MNYLHVSHCVLTYKQIFKQFFRVTKSIAVDIRNENTLTSHACMPSV